MILSPLGEKTFWGAIIHLCNCSVFNYCKLVDLYPAVCSGFLLSAISFFLLSFLNTLDFYYQLSLNELKKGLYFIHHQIY